MKFCLSRVVDFVFQVGEPIAACCEHLAMARDKDCASESVQLCERIHILIGSCDNLLVGANRFLRGLREGEPAAQPSQNNNQFDKLINHRYSGAN
jgi:hypothetical protein